MVHREARLFGKLTTFTQVKEAYKQALNPVLDDEQRQKIIASAIDNACNSTDPRVRAASHKNLVEMEKLRLEAAKKLSDIAIAESQIESREKIAAASMTTDLSIAASSSTRKLELTDVHKILDAMDKTTSDEPDEPPTQPDDDGFDVLRVEGAEDG